MKALVVHFVTGGFSGATQVAIDLVRARPQHSVLVLRRKRNTDAARVQALRDEGLQVHVVPGWSHIATVWSLRQWLRQQRPQALVAHGFSEHLWGRWAGLWAGVPVMIHVEHSPRERYTAWRLWQARYLARHTARLVGVSEGVRDRLIELGFERARCLAIPNGIEVARFATDASSVPASRRPHGLVMVARFAAQKDQATLLRALALLRDEGLVVPALLVGGGRDRHRQQAAKLLQLLKLAPQVELRTHASDVPALLASHRLAVLSTHYEGLALGVIEAMASGCAVVGSDVVGVSESIQDGVTGRLVQAGSARALADAIAQLWQNDAMADAMAAAGRAHALAHYDARRMLADYERLLASLTQAATPSD